MGPGVDCAAAGRAANDTSGASASTKIKTKRARNPIRSAEFLAALADTAASSVGAKIRGRFAEFNLRVQTWVVTLIMMPSVQPPK